MVSLEPIGTVVKYHFAHSDSLTTALNSVPDVEDVSQHEVLDVDVVGGGAGGEDVREVGELLDHDDAVVAGGREEAGDGVGDEHGDQDGDDVSDLAGHLEHDHAVMEERESDQLQ